MGSDDGKGVLGPDDPSFRIKPVQQMAASCTGALTTSLIMTPLDVVKIRLQAQRKNNLMSKKCFVYCNGLMDHMCPCFHDDTNYWFQRRSQFKGTLVRLVTLFNLTLCGPRMGSNNHTCLCIGCDRKGWFRRSSQLNGTVDAFVKITRNEGPMSLWSGLSPTLVLAVPATVVYFVTYEQLRNQLNDRFCEGQQPLWVPLAAGCTARTWSATVVSPLELVRTKMQSKRLSWLEIHEALRSLLQYHGYRGLWKGLQPTLFRDVPFSGIYWVSYETIKAKYCVDSQISFWTSFIAGSISGTIAAVCTIPFDVVKTHQQIELAEEIYMEAEPKFKLSTFSVLHEIYRVDGVRGLFTGLIPRVIKVAPACAIMVSTFEYGKTFFEKYNYSQYRKSRGDL